ncbi:signal peptidase II [Candidatus Pelagibacter sp.]|nr:signal peptidase II [Candidatus Pelagibacter sp.]
MLRGNFFYFFIISLIFLADRISKLWIISLSNSDNHANIEFLSFINLHLIWNKGIAFGLFSFSEKSNYNLLTVLIMIIIIVVFWMMVRSKGIEKYGFLMVFGGSLGNVFDRLYYSSVPDFIDIYYKNFHWFIFNVADIFITLGVIVLILNEFVLKNQK